MHKNSNKFVKIMKTDKRQYVGSSFIGKYRIHYESYLLDQQITKHYKPSYRKVYKFVYSI